jgi:uncharacterized protein (TIGR00369 family)
MRPSRITAAEFARLLEEGMPSARVLAFEVVTLEEGHAVLRRAAGPETLRPGGTVSGPTLFAFADLAMYAAVLSAVGPVPLAVTTDATIHFLRKPGPGTLVARARILKKGARLVVGDVIVASEGDDASPVVHAVMTYSVPPHRAQG